MWQSDPEWIAGFEYLMSKLHEIGEERNALLHSAWSSSESGTFLRLRSRYDRRTKSLQQNVERLELGDLEEFHKSVNWHWYLLTLSLRMEIGFKVPIAAPVPPIGPSREAKLISSLLLTARAAGIGLQTIANSVGIDSERLSALALGEGSIDAKGPEYGGASFLLHFLQKLLMRYDGDLEKMHTWLNSPHPALATTPLLALQRADGLVALAGIDIEG